MFGFLDASQVEGSWTEARWHLFAQLSPYSPLNLADLPQPVPKDCRRRHRRHLEPSFKDAFEDLLLVSAGRDMPDHKTRRQAKEYLRHLFPRGEPSSYWVQRLHSQGLLGTYFPPMSREWPAWGWGVNGTERGSPSRKPDGSGDDINQCFGQIARAVEQILSGQQPQNTKSEAAEAQPTTAAKGRQQSEEDMYQAVRSAWAQGHDSLAALVRSVDQAWEGSNDAQERIGKEVTADAGESVARTVTTREEYTDEQGSSHLIVKTRRLDKSGNEISQETRHTVKREWEEACSVPEKPRGQQEEKGRSSGRGWFWS